MTNGFYDLSSLDTKEKLKQFYTSAIMLSYHVVIHYLPGTAREIDRSMSLADMLKLVDTTHHNVCINREMYNRGAIPTEDIGEVGFSTLGRGKGLYLFCYMNRDNFNKLVRKFKLKLKK
jgi:hypothetical protein